MKSLKTAKVGLMNSWFPAVSYYVIFCAVICLIIFLGKAWGGVVNGVSVDGSSSIFLFIMGIIMIRSLFFFTQSNCVSRKSFFTGFLLYMLIGTAIFTVANMVLNRIFLLVTTEEGAKVFFYQIYPKGNIFGEFLYGFLQSMNYLSAGALVSMVYYRLNLIGKWLISIFGVLCFTLFPALGVMFFPMWILEKVGTWIVKLFTFYYTSPYHGTLILLVLLAAEIGISFLCVRRATVKETPGQ